MNFIEVSLVELLEKLDNPSGLLALCLLFVFFFGYRYEKAANLTGFTAVIFKSVYLFLVVLGAAGLGIIGFKNVQKFLNNSELQVLRTENNSIKAEKNKLIFENEELKNISSASYDVVLIQNYLALSRDKADVEIRLAEITAERNKLRQENQRLALENDSAEQNNSSLKNDFLKLKNDYSSLNIDYDALKQNNSRAEAELLTLKNDNSNLSDSNNILTRENANLKNDLFVLKSDYEKLGQDNNILAKNNADLKTDYEILSNSNDVLIKDNANLKNDLLTLKNDYEILSVEKIAVDEKLNLANLSIDTMSNELTSFNKSEYEKAIYTLFLGDGRTAKDMQTYYDKALKFFRDKANVSVTAQFFIGYILDTTHKNITISSEKKDAHNAALAYQEAANNGYKDAQFFLAEMYRNNGQFELAKKWYETVAKDGDKNALHWQEKDALYWLGYMYARKEIKEINDPSFSETEDFKEGQKNAGR